MENIFKLIQDELDHQNAKWGANRHLDPLLWATVLGEEYGEVCRAILEHDQQHCVAELVDVAAVCISMILDIQRTETPFLLAAKVLRFKGGDQVIVSNPRMDLPGFKGKIGKVISIKHDVDGVRYKLVIEGDWIISFRDHELSPLSSETPNAPDAAKG